jgi:hypothetical protein
MLWGAATVLERFSFMKRMIFPGVGAALLCAPVLIGWSPPESAAPDLKDGKAYSEVAPAPNGAVLIHAVIDIPAPAKVVWEVMNNCKYATRLITTVTSCKILESDPAHGADVRETVTKGNLFLPTIYNIVREQFDLYRSIRFQKAGGNLKEEQGEWRLTPLGAGAITRVTYENQVAADILAPPGLVREAMKHDTAKVLVNLRRESLAALK